MPEVVDYSWGRVGGNNTAHAQAVCAAEADSPPM